MANAKIDLAATIRGHFSPQDWAEIFKRAQQMWVENLAKAPGVSDTEAWHDVIRDFHLTHYWGYSADYRPIKVKKPKSLGVQLIWIAFNSFTIMKVAVLWFGQIYSRSDEPADKWIFLGVIFLIISNIVYFLWSNRGYQDASET